MSERKASRKGNWDCEHKESLSHAKVMLLKLNEMVGFVPRNEPNLTILFRLNQISLKAARFRARLRTQNMRFFR